MAATSPPLPHPTHVASRPPMSNARRRQLWGWLFLSPWIVGFFLFFAVPMLASLALAFSNFNLARPEQFQWVGWANWVRLMRDPLVAVGLRATAWFALIALPLAVLVPLGLAVLLHNRYLWGKPVFRTLFYMPYVVPLVSAIFIWGGFLNSQSGWLNRGLRALGLPAPNWLDSVTWIYPALYMIGLWGAGNAMLTMLAGMNGVPTDLYEAAKVDGAGPLRRFRAVTFPMISPVIFFNLVLSVIGLVRYFEVPYILKQGTGDPGNATYFINIHFYKTAFSFQDMGYGAAQAWLIFAVAMVATLVLFASARYWVYYAAGE